MQIGVVCGNATSTVKHPSMKGWKLLLVQPLMADGATHDGHPVLAIDDGGAGLGDRVIITSDGESTRTLLGVKATPVRWRVLGIVDDGPANR